MLIQPCQEKRRGEEVRGIYRVIVNICPSRTTLTTDTHTLHMVSRLKMRAGHGKQLNKSLENTHIFVMKI